MELDRVLEVLRALNDEGVEYVVVGAVALNLHGLPRATEDIDVFIRASEQNVARVRSALHRLWDDAHIDEISADDLSGEYPVVRYGPPNEDFMIDLLSRLGEAFGFDDLVSEVISVGDVPVRLATPATMYAMKRDTARAQDRADAQALKDRFDLGGA